jgi:hypothetical protein
MADFRRWLYALALVALIVGITIPASAQSGGFTCSIQANTDNVRAEGYTEQVGDVVIVCNGGQPTTAGQAVPQASITAQLNTNITSKLLSSSGWSDALIIIDEPNSSSNPNTPILNCGNGGNDVGQSGAGVCSIISDGNPAHTYSGLKGYQGCGTTSVGPCSFTTNHATWDAIGSPAGNSSTNGTVQSCSATTYGCSFPNVFQAHTGTAQNTGQANSVVWSNVPIDPPGSNWTRTIRITNVRSDAESLGVSTTLTLASVTMSLNVQPSTALPINANSIVVASVYRGLIVTAPHTRLDFTQCNSENSKLFGGTISGGIPYFGQCSTSSSSSSGTITSVPPGSSNSTASCFGGAGGGSANSLESSSIVNDNGDYVLSTPAVRFAEGFNTAFKARNISALSGSTPMGSGSTGGWAYNGSIAFNGDQNQDVPGAVYATESGFEYYSTAADPSPNPPLGISSTAVFGSDAGYSNAFSSTSTGIVNAGYATQGTRLIATFGNVPNGANIYIPTVTYLYRQTDPYYGGSSTVPGDPTKYFAGHSTGVAVLVQTDAAGNSNILSVPTTIGQTAPMYQVPLTAGAGYATFEVLFDDPGSQEQMDVPVVVAYAANLTANPPIGLPVPGTIATVTGGFAPFYTSIDGTASNARLPQQTTTWPYPRFIPGATTLSLFEINKCECNLLFPYVTNTFGYDTGIAIANTSQDPGGGVPNTNDFGAAQPQSGAVTLWYYGQGANNTTAPASQVSSVIPAGQLLLFTLSTGNPAQNIDNRGAGFEGYIIAQAAFEYCHAYAIIEAQGGGATNPATGYLGIVLDQQGLPRTNSPGENDAH